MDGEGFWFRVDRKDIKWLRLMPGPPPQWEGRLIDNRPIYIRYSRGRVSYALGEQDGLLTSTEKVWESDIDPNKTFSELLEIIPFPLATERRKVWYK